MATYNEPKSNYNATDEVVPGIFNELAENEKYLKEQVDLRLKTSEVSSAVVQNTQLLERTNLVDSEQLGTGFGKIRKWFTDIKALAFKSVITESDISGTISASKISGTVASSTTATKLATPRAIKLSGVTATPQNFDGTSNITIPVTAVPASLLNGTITIDSTGNSGSTTKLKTPREISVTGVTSVAQNFDGTEDITIKITGIPASLLSGTASINITGNSASATKLATSRFIDISGVTATAQYFNGTSNITIPITAVPASLLTGTISTYRLPKGNASSIGGVKSGGNVAINSDGTMTATASGSGVTVTARSALGNYTNLDDVLAYIAEVFTGNRTVTKIKANTFDVI